MNHSLLMSLRDIPEGCHICTRPAMMLTRPTPPATHYSAVCEHHLAEPCEYYHGPEDHDERCDVELYDLIPLDELLDELGVMR